MRSASYYHNYYLEHREHLLELSKEWQRNNRKRINENNRYRYRTDSVYREHKIEAERIRRERRRANA